MILVVGGLGFIGSHTTRALLEAGYDVVVTQHRPGNATTDAVVVPLDVRDRAATLAIGDRHDITGIVFLAGAWPTNPTDELRDVAAGLVNIVDAAIAWKVPRISIASTLGVYGYGAGGMREDAPIAIASAHPIPAHKKLAEIFAEQVAQRTAIECVVLRIAAIYGPRNRGMRSFPALLAHSLAQRKPMDLSRLVWGSGPDDGFDHCYVKDCARAIASVQTAASLHHRVYNIGSGAGTRNRDFATAARSIAPDVDLGLPPAFAEPAAREAPWLDISRLRNDTGFAPRFDPSSALRDYLAWLAAGNSE
jgi:UDP-glucose 4-epimerase